MQVEFAYLLEHDHPVHLLLPLTLPLGRLPSPSPPQLATPTPPPAPSVMGLSLLEI